jgi:hypothetical protein
MRNILKNIFIVALIALATGCTKDFAEINKNPNMATEQDLIQDGNNLGAFFQQMQMNIYPYDGVQTQTNLTGDAYCQYMVPPTPFVGNVNNVTYYFTWIGDQWNNAYKNTMAVVLHYKTQNVDKLQPNFWAWANILKIFTMSRTTDYYGPIIYSQYGTNKAVIDYDLQKDVYNSFFLELDTIVNLLKPDADAGTLTFKKFDLSYGGNVQQWVKVANSLRLRLAIRISKVDPARAKIEAEKAIVAPYGVIENNIDNYFVSSTKGAHPLKMISLDWGDARMCATFESILKGYNDPRMKLDFQPANTNTSSPDGTVEDGDYKGIRQGIKITSKTTYLGYSPIGIPYTTTSQLQIMTAAEIYLIRAEGVLRGWNMGGGTAREYYEAGVKASFDQLGASGYSTYIIDDTSKFADYVDTHNADNSFKATSDVTIKWNENLTNEQKLEKIITQKWIAVFPDGQESWAEFRRTGYPKLKPVVVNNSGGTISTSDFVRRMIYPTAEYDNNNAAITKAASTLTGIVNTPDCGVITGDKGGSRVWWDTANAAGPAPNFP